MEVDVQKVFRYFRLLGALARYSLANEMAFRGNFLVKILVEVIWLTILLIFYSTLFNTTDQVAQWNREQYLFFIGCYFALEGLIETLFLSNCGEFTELVRTGNLDLYLLKPVDEQFMVSCRNVDWSTAPNVLMGLGVMLTALIQMGWTWSIVKILGFLVVFPCGVAIAYSFLLVLTSSSVYMVRNQSLLEMWWLATSLMRYPKEIFSGSWDFVGRIFTFIIPILLAVNIPAQMMVKIVEPEILLLTVAATAALLFLSRRFFLMAMRSYRSASS
jgi:ABC-2 type transport system permease protein